MVNDDRTSEKILGFKGIRSNNVMLFFLSYKKERKKLRFESRNVLQRRQSYVLTRKIISKLKSCLIVVLLSLLLLTMMMMMMMMLIVIISSKQYIRFARISSSESSTSALTWACRMKCHQSFHGNKSTLLTQMIKLNFHFHFLNCSKNLFLLASLFPDYSLLDSVTFATRLALQLYLSPPTSHTESCPVRSP